LDKEKDVMPPTGTLIFPYAITTSICASAVANWIRNSRSADSTERSERLLIPPPLQVVASEDIRNRERFDNLPERYRNSYANYSYVLFLSHGINIIRIRDVSLGNAANWVTLIRNLISSPGLYCLTLLGQTEDIEPHTIGIYIGNDIYYLFDPNAGLYSCYTEALFMLNGHYLYASYRDRPHCNLVKVAEPYQQ
jgi:hypothetical protein